MEGILALDPAGPIFDVNSEQNKLGKNDAKAVQVLHTASSGGFPIALGFNANCGSVDFYFNGAKHQPGCKKDTNCDHAYANNFIIALNKRSRYRDNMRNIF